MKKILFVVRADTNNPVGLRLYIDFPYGQTDKITWEILPYEHRLREQIKLHITKYDIIYDIRLGSTMVTSNLEDLAIVNNINTETLTACAYVHTPYLLWDDSLVKKNCPLRNLHLTGITLQYQKTNDAQYDYMRIKSDFLNIIHQRTSKNTPKRLYKTDRTITQEEQEKYQLSFKEFKKLDLVDKKLLGLSPTECYIVLFVENENIHEEKHCYVSKKIRDVIHFDAWLELTTNKDT